MRIILTIDRMALSVLILLLASVALALPSLDDQELPVSYFVRSGSERFPNVSSDRMHFLSPTSSLLDDDPTWKQFIPFRSSPTGTETAVLSQDCDWHRIAELWQTGSTVDQVSSVQDYLQHCEDELAQGQQKGMTALAQLISMNYAVETHPRIRPVRIRVGDGESAIYLTGYLALQPGSEARPMILARCGIFCNVGKRLSAQILMHLFEDSPFHVLLLSNTTGSDFARDNNKALLGGLEDGRELLEIGRWLLSDDSKMKKMISSLHLVGQSLGGNGALMASLFDSVAKKTIFSSTIALCPVVDLQRTFMDALEKPHWFARHAFDYETRAYLLKSYPYLSGIQSAIPQDYSQLQDVELFGKLQNWIVHLSLDFINKTGLPEPFASSLPFSQDDYWKNQNFSHFAQELKNDLLVLASDNDFVVPPAQNAWLLDRRPDFPKVQVLRYKYGNHCAMDFSSGWSLMSAVLRRFVLNHSPEFTNRLKNVRKKIVFKGLSLTGTHLQQVWQSLPYDKKIRLRLVTNLASQTFDIPYAALPIPQEIREQVQQVGPKGENAAHRINRWAQANLLVLGADGELLTGTEGKPTYVQSSELESIDLNFSSLGMIENK